MRRNPIDPIDEAGAPGWTGDDDDRTGIGLDSPDTVGATRRSTRREGPKRHSLPLRVALGGAVVFVVGLLATAGAKGYRDLQIVRQREAELSVRISASEERLEALDHRLQLLRDDPATLERLAREELGLVGPNDIIFVLPDDPVARQAPEAQ